MEFFIEEINSTDDEEGDITNNDINTMNKKIDARDVRVSNYCNSDTTNKDDGRNRVATLTTILGADSEQHQLHNSQFDNVNNSEAVIHGVDINEISLTKETAWTCKLLLRCFNSEHIKKRTSSSGEGGGSTLTNVNGEAYLFGGCSRMGVIHAGVRRYDMTSNCWSEPLVCSGSSPTPRFGHTAIAHEQYLYIFGGQGFHPTSNIRHEHNDNIGKHECHAKQEAHSDGIYCYNDLYVLDTLSMSWSKVNATAATAGCIQFPAPRHSHTSVVLDNKMVLFGGASSDGTLLNDLWELSLRSIDKNHGNNFYLWKRLNPVCDIPPPREMHSMNVLPQQNDYDDAYDGVNMDTIKRKCSMNSRLYVTGGRGRNGDILQDHWELQQKFDKWVWKELPSPPSRRCSHSSSFISLQKCLATSTSSPCLFIFGGWDAQSGTIFSDIMLYDIGAATWKNIAVNSTAETDLTKSRNNQNESTEKIKLITHASSVTTYGRFAHSCCTIESNQINLNDVEHSEDCHVSNLGSLGHHNKLKKETLVLIHGGVTVENDLNDLLAFKSCR